MLADVPVHVVFMLTSIIMHACIFALKSNANSTDRIIDYFAFVSEYAKQIQSTPEVPFHPEVKPDTGILKATPTSGRKTTPILKKKRSMAADFF